MEGDTVTYEEIDTPPDYVAEYNGVWFDDALSFITKYRLKEYMKQNNLVINSGEYRFKNTVRIDEIKELFGFQ